MAAARVEDRVVELPCFNRVIDLYKDGIRLGRLWQCFQGAPWVVDRDSMGSFTLAGTAKTKKQGIKILGNS